MIIDRLSTHPFEQWSDVPLPQQAEIAANEAPIAFIAQTSLSEKIQRLFNGLMFAIAGAKLLSHIPGVANGALTLFKAMGGAALMQVPHAAAIWGIACKALATLALIVVVRKILAIAINYIVYPATLVTLINKKAIDDARQQAFTHLTNQKFDCRRIALNQSGINYDAFVLEHETTKGNGQWVVVAGGNGWIGEDCIESCARRFKELGFNTLFVNGPGVGCSTGFPTSYSIGAAQEAAFQFLEEGVKAEKILLYGTSLGAGAQAEAIKNHNFKNNINYIVWSDRSFDTLSNAASSMVTALAKPLFFFLGIELDGVAGAKKLEELGITHIITQNSHDANGILPLDPHDADNQTDGVIPNQASLYTGLIKAGIQKSERIKCYGNAYVDHNGDLPYKIELLVINDLLTFLQPNAPLNLK